VLLGDATGLGIDRVDLVRDGVGGVLFALSMTIQPAAPPGTVADRGKARRRHGSVSMM
jgi:hypothetical protein